MTDTKPDSQKPDPDTGPNADADRGPTEAETLESIARFEGPGLSGDFVELVEQALYDENQQRLDVLLSALDPEDIADLLGFISVGDRRQVLAVLDRDALGEVLPELDEGVREEVLALVEPRQIAEVIEDLESDDAALLVEDLGSAQRAEVLAAVDPEERAVIESALGYEEDSVGRMMRREIFAAPDFWTVGQVIDHMREHGEELPEKFYEIYVVDPKLHPIGAVSADQILRKPRATPLSAILEEDAQVVSVNTPEADVAYIFEKYHLFAAGVVDEDGRLVGQITVDDVLDVMQEQNRRSALSMAGVTGSGRNVSILGTTRSRFWWLLVNLFTAVLSAWVISWFENDIARIAILAALAPVVASMGGNAGAQTMTVVVRALATKELTSANTWRTLGRETTVGVINGIMFAALTAAVVILWHHDTRLAFVIAVAMVANHIAAAVAGAMIPIGLSRAKVDPAVSSTVFVTTVTDIVGFFAFLALASLMLL